MAEGQEEMAWGAKPSLEMTMRSLALNRRRGFLNSRECDKRHIGGLGECVKLKKNVK